MDSSVDIVLVQPPGWSKENPQLGLSILKSYLKDRNITSKIFDFNILLYLLRTEKHENLWDLSNGYYTWSRESFVKNLLRDYEGLLLAQMYSILSLKPKVIGFSVHYSSVLSAKFIALKFKQLSPETKIVFGGPQVAHYTKEWQILLQDGTIDAVVFGEAEESLVQYIISLRNGNAEALIRGVAFTANNTRVVVNGGPSGLIKNLDILPFADFSDYDLDLYAGRNVLPTYFSRGCVNHCNYCTENKFFPGFRSRSGSRVFEEVRYQLSQYPKVKYFRMHDSVSNGNMKELEKFCDLLIENKTSIGFNLENAIVRKEMNSTFYQKLNKAGCNLIGYGVETPSKRLLKSVGKQACLDADFHKVVSDGVKNGQTIGINMMFGLPEENEADFKEQLNFVKKIKKYKRRVIINPALNFCYFPEGSEGYQNPEKFNLDMRGGEMYWSAQNGRNAFPERLRRFEVFCTYTSKLGFSNLFGVIANLNKNELLGNYYKAIKNYEMALPFLLKSFDEENSLLELAYDIKEIYELTAKYSDKDLQRITEFIASKQAIKTSWDDVCDIESLRQFILRLSVAGLLRKFRKTSIAPAWQEIFKVRSLGDLKAFIKVFYRYLFKKDQSGLDFLNENIVNILDLKIVVAATSLK